MSQSRNIPPCDHDWEERLKRGLGDPPVPNFDAWSARYPDAIGLLRTGVSRSSARRRHTVVRKLQLVVAVLVVTALLGWLVFSGQPTQKAFANNIPGVDNVKALTWTTTYYLRVTSADGKRTWLQKERRMHAYRHPGQYRETILDESGEPRSVRVTDVRVGRLLEIDLRDKKATLKTPSGVLPDVRGPFAWVGDALRERMVADTLRVKSVSLVGQRSVDDTEADVVRVLIEKGNGLGYAVHDFLFDRESKQLVGVWTPNEPNFEPHTTPDRNSPPEEEWSRQLVVGALQHEIVVRENMDASLFSMDAPAGFTFEALAKPTVTEEEMIAYIAAAARFNDGMFPDSPFMAFDQAKFNAAVEKPPRDRTAAEQTLIDWHDKFLMREIHRSPVRQFVEDQTAPSSFYYVGAGVQVGQANRLVCWYQLRSGKSYRAVYGDLSVKDVTRTELPFDVTNDGR